MWAAIADQALKTQYKQQPTKGNQVHYKNGRPAKNGDKIILIQPAGYYGQPSAGILYDARSDGGNDCNGRIAQTNCSDPVADLKNCLHVDDVAAATIPDSTSQASPCCDHKSDCAVHNEPALPAGDCNCKP